MLDKSVVKRIAVQTNIATKDGDGSRLFGFAQAIYALGVKDERERIAKLFDEAGWHPYAKIIRES